LYSLCMKAVWTILGWWTAAAAAAGAGMMMLSGSCCDIGCPRSFSPLTLTSLSGLFVADAGADEVVGVVISIGSPGDGADIWIVGAIIGTVLAPIDSSDPSPRWCLGALSVWVAICPAHLVQKTVSTRRFPAPV
jgi:hypothetical protein